MKINKQSLLDIWAHKAHAAYWLVGAAALSFVNSLIDEPLNAAEEARQRTNDCVDKATNTRETAHCLALHEKFRSCLLSRDEARDALECLSGFRADMTELHTAPTLSN